MAKGKEHATAVRLPLHRASLFFVPEFTENFDDWKRGIEAILDQFDWGQKVTVEPLEDQLGITVVYRQITVSVFRGSGQLSLKYNPRYRLDDDYIPCLNCFGLPGSVCSKIDRFLRCRPLKTRQRALERDILETVASSILEVKECLRLNMRAAFQQGRARIEGRIDTPTASYSLIPSVQHFKASVPCKCSVGENCDHFTTLDERASPEGRPPQRLYDVHVAVDQPLVEKHMAKKQPAHVQISGTNNGGFNWKPIEEAIKDFLSKAENHEFLRRRDWNSRLRKRFKGLCTREFGEEPARSTLALHIGRIVTDLGKHPDKRPSEGSDTSDSLDSLDGRLH